MVVQLKGWQKALKAVQQSEKLGQDQTVRPERSANFNFGLSRYKTQWPMFHSL